MTFTLQNKNKIKELVLMILHFRQTKIHYLIVMSFLLGASTVLAFAPASHFLLPILTLSALFWLWLHCTPAQSAWTGFSFGLGFFGFGVNWMFVTLTLTQMPIILSVLLWLLFCSLLALFPTLAGWLQSESSAKPIIRLLILMPRMMLLMDWIRTWLFTGFPWLVDGYSHPLAGYAAIFGALGVSYVLLRSAVLLVHAICTAQMWGRWAALSGIALKMNSAMNLPERCRKPLCWSL